MQGVADTGIFSERQEPNAQVEPEVDGLLARVTAVRQVLQSPKRLFKARHRLPIGRTRYALAPACRQYTTALSHTSPRRA